VNELIAETRNILGLGSPAMCLTPENILSKPSSKNGNSLLPRSLSSIFLVFLTNKATPKYASSSLICWLTAAYVTFKWSAANLKLES